MLCVAFLALAPGPACGAEPAYPTRPVRLLVPFAPGGGADALARIITPEAARLAGTAVGRRQPGRRCRQSRGGDGRATLRRTATPCSWDSDTVLTVNPSLYKLPFSMEKDLQPVTLLATAQYILVLHPSVPADTLKEFIAVAKQKPGRFNYASAGVGSPLHLAAELFKKRAGVDMVHVAYKGGGPAAASVLAGETQVLFGSVASSMPQVKAGRLKALATTGMKRSKVAPELPTIAESGFPGFDVQLVVRVPGAGENAHGHRQPAARGGDQGARAARGAGAMATSGPGDRDQHAAGARRPHQDRDRGLGGGHQGGGNQGGVASRGAELEMRHIRYFFAICEHGGSRARAKHAG